MAIRQTTHVLKNSSIVNRPLPSSLKAGEPIINTADGILYFSGVSSSSNEWTPAGTGTTANFFEVGSNLYDLQLRNKITIYEDISGAGLVGKFLSGTTNGFVLSDISDIAGVDSFVTGGTFNKGSEEITLTLSEGNSDVVITGLTDIFTTSANLIGSTIYFDRGTDLSAYTADLSTLDINDTFVTGITYSNSLLTVKRNQNEVDLTTVIDTVSGLTVSNLTAGRVIYVGTSGELTDEIGFTYDDITNSLSIPSNGTMNVGTGGLNVGGDAIIQGSLTVLGQSVSAFTSDLYVEDPNITLNYNPTGNTIATSIGAGWTIKDGNGIISGNVNFDIRRMDTLSGLTVTQIPDITEYTAATGNVNRGWVTQLNDIIIRSNNITGPNGVRVLAEFDVLDGGQY